MIAVHFAAFISSPLPASGDTAAAIAGLLRLTWAACPVHVGPFPTAGKGPVGGFSRRCWRRIRSTSAYRLQPVTAGPSIPAAPVRRLASGSSPSRVAQIKPSAALGDGQQLLPALDLLLLFQHRPGNGGDLALNAVLFTVYIGCCTHFFYAYRRATAGAFITIAGFLAWASVFLVAPVMQAFCPSIHVEGRGVESAQVRGCYGHDLAAAGRSDYA